MDLTPESNEIVIRVKFDYPERQQKEKETQVHKSEKGNNHLMTVSDLCKRLKCEPSYIYRLTHERRIPYIKLGNRTVRFDPRQIEEWLANYRVGASDTS